MTTASLPFPLIPGVHQNKAAFIEGVRLILLAWPALKLAVDMGFGGADSAEKRTWFSKIIVDYFEQRKHFTKYTVCMA